MIICPNCKVGNIKLREDGKCIACGLEIAKREKSQKRRQCGFGVLPGDRFCGDHDPPMGGSVVQ